MPDLTSQDLTTTTIETVETLDDAERFLRWLSERREVLAIDLETTGVDWWRDDIRICSFGDQHSAWVIDFGEWKGLVRTALERYTGDIVGHNFTFDLMFLSQHLGWPTNRWKWGRIHDTQTLAAIVHPLEPRALKHLTARFIDPRAAAGQARLEEDMKRGKWDWATVPMELESFQFYAGVDVVITARLWHLLRPDCPDRAYECEMQVEGILMRMMDRGFLVDLDYCHRTKAQLLERADVLHSEIEALGVTTPNSPQQIVQKLLFDGVRLTERTEGGSYSVAKDILATIDHPLAERIVEYRNVTKWAETYLTNFIEMADSDGRVRPSFRQHAARTLRMSVTRPALQTLPQGPLIRNAVIAPEGFKVVEVDQSNVEARLFACFAQEEGMLKVIREGGDLHAFAARRTFGLADDAEVKGDLRRIAKGITFGALYGAGVPTLAKTAGIDEDEMRPIARRYFDAFPGVKRWQKEVQEEGLARYAAGEGCYVETYMGTKLYVDDPEFAYKLPNAAIQGSARLVLGERLVSLDSAGLADYIFAVVHDEVDLYVPEDIAHDVTLEVQEAFTDWDTFEVPLEAGVSEPVDRWGEASH